jgi:uncharacterized protein (DUF2141 family)
MVKRIISMVVCCLLILPTFLWAESQGFKVTGEISFSKTGDIYVAIVTKAQFEQGARERAKAGENKKAQKPSPFSMIITIGEVDQKTHKVSFVFENVPTGTYGIEAFQDVNGNGQLDMGMFGAKEPWGMYRPSRPALRGPKFEEIAFEVKQDLTDMRLELK